MKARLPAALLAAALYLPALGQRDLWHPNEPTYGEAVAEMAQDHAWLIPTVNGIPFPEKPILYYWLARIFSMLLGGVTELTLRLPSALAGIAAVILLHRLVQSYAGAKRASAAAIVLATTYIVFWSARSVQMDLLLAACTLAAIAALAGVLDLDRNPRRAFLAAGTAAGLGALAKGPIGLVLPILVVVPYALATRQLRKLIDPRALHALAAFVLVAAPWYAALAVRGETDFLTELLFRQNVERFAAGFDHPAPWWYFLEALAVDMLPWSLFLPLAWGIEPRDDREKRLLTLAWIWLAAIVLFFSFSASKRSPYILPAAPAVAILVSTLFQRWRERTIDPSRRTCALGLLTTFGFALAASSLLITRALGDRLASPPELHRAGLAAAALAMGGGVAILAGAVASWRQRFGAALGLLVFAVASYVTGSLHVLPQLDAIKSHRPFCEAIAKNVAPEAPLIGYRLWKWRAAYSFYSGRRIASLDSREALTGYWSRPERVFVVVEHAMLDEFRATVGDPAPLAEHAAGSNRAYLFANR